MKTEKIKIEKTKTKKTKTEQIQSGIALASTFLLMSFFFFLYPSYFEIETVTYIIGIIFAIIGIMGLGIELNKIGSSPKGIGFDNLGIGIGLLVIWILAFYYFNIWWVNAFISPIMLLGVYAILLGILNIFYSLFSNPQESIKVKLTMKLPVVITQFAGFLLTIMQILQLLKILE